MKSFIAKTRYIHFGQLRYLRFKLLKYKENNKKICNTFDHTSKYSFIYNEQCIIRKYYFVLYNGALTLKMSKMALNAFCDKTLQMLKCYFYFRQVSQVNIETSHGDVSSVETLGEGLSACCHLANLRYTVAKGQLKNNPGDG